MSAKKSKPAKKQPTQALVLPSVNNGRAAPEERVLAQYSESQQVIVSESQFRILYEKVPPYAIKHRPGPGGRSLAYIPHGYAQDRINKVFGGDWDFEVVTDAFGGQPYNLTVEKVSRYVTVLGRLTVRIRNPARLSEILTTVTKTEFGSATWNENIEFGDALKSASSDSFKRCCLRLGIGGDLYYDDDAAQSSYEDKKKLAADLQQAAAVEALKVAPTTLSELFVKANQRWKLIADDLQRILDTDLAGISKRLTDDPSGLWSELEQKAEVRK